MGSIRNLVGSVFGRLTVISMSDERRGKGNLICWNCICECGKTVSVMGISLTQEHTKSCGCYNKDRISQRSKKYNDYDLESKEYGVGRTSQGIEFIFDKNDFDKIKEYCWSVDSKGYLQAKIPRQSKMITFHRLILDFPNCDVDHVNRNRLDNRRSNLRLATKSQNRYNTSMKKSNNSGVIGIKKIVHNSGKTVFIASLAKDKKEVLNKTFENFEDAVIARLQAEKEYFGEFAPQIHLFEEYGIA